MFINKPRSCTIKITMVERKGKYKQYVLHPGVPIPRTTEWRMIKSNDNNRSNHNNHHQLDMFQNSNLLALMQLA